MAWTARLVSKSLDKGVLSVTVSYTDGVRTITETYSASNLVYNPEWVQNIAAGRIASLTDLDAKAQVLSVGAVPSPTPEPVVDKTSLRALLAKANMVTNLIAVGAIAKTDSRVVALASAISAKLVTEWDNV